MGNASSSSDKAPVTTRQLADPTVGLFVPLAVPEVATLLRNTGSSPERNDGNVDFVFADAAHGFAFVADGVGHNYPTTGVPARQRDRMHTCWGQFSQRLSSFLETQAAAGCTIVELEKHVRGQLHEVSEDFCMFGKSSTFSMAIVLTKCSDMSSICLFCVSLADSGMVIVPSAVEPRAAQLVNFDSQQLRNIEIGGDTRAAEFLLHPVTAGALVVGLTDGTLDAIAYQPRVIPPPPLAGSPVLEVASGEAAYGTEWMARCLLEISGVVAQVSTAAGATEPPPAEEVLEALFAKAWQMTSNCRLEPDDCASFAFYLPSANNTSP